MTCSHLHAGERDVILLTDLLEVVRESHARAYVRTVKWADVRWFQFNIKIDRCFVMQLWIGSVTTVWERHRNDIYSFFFLYSVTRVNVIEKILSVPIYKKRFIY